VKASAAPKTMCPALWMTTSVAASGLAHAGVNGVTCDGESACREGAKTARSSCDDDDVLHIDSPVLRVWERKG
jgi:hypothetical protein